MIKTVQTIQAVIYYPTRVMLWYHALKKYKCLETLQETPKRPRMNIEAPKSTSSSIEKGLDRYEIEKTPDRIMKMPFRSQEKRLEQGTIEQGKLRKFPF